MDHDYTRSGIVLRKDRLVLGVPEVRTENRSEILLVPHIDPCGLPITGWRLSIEHFHGAAEEKEDIWLYERHTLEEVLQDRSQQNPPRDSTPGIAGVGHPVFANTARLPTVGFGFHSFGQYLIPD